MYFFNYSKKVSANSLYFNGELFILIWGKVGVETKIIINFFKGGEYFEICQKK